MQETAWPFITKQELLAALCRALLSAGRWKLARSYLTHTSSTPIPADTAESLVISAARDYFYSASTSDGPEIALVCSWRAQITGCQGPHELTLMPALDTPEAALT